MRLAQRLGVWVGLTVFVGCQVAAPGEFDPTPVFVAVLDTIAVEFQDTGRRAVLDPAVGWSPPTETFEAIKAPSNMVRAYVRANAQGGRLPEVVTDSLGLQLVDSEALGRDPTSFDGVSDALGFGAYVVYLSYPGFSPDGSSAILDYSFSCGSLCGEGHVARLERRGGRWVIVSDYMYVIS